VTTENQPPWAAAATDEPARRKVSWGDTAHSSDAPRPRAGVPVPPSFGPTWAPETTDTTASDTALQHAGTAPPEAQQDWQVPAVPGGYVPVPTPDEPPAGADVDFASLFDDDEVAPDPAEDPPAQPAVGDIFDDEPTAHEMPPAQPAVGEAIPATAQPAAPDAAPVARQSMMSAHRAAAQEARVGAPGGAYQDTSLADARYTDIERLYGYVDRILGLLAGGDPGIQAMTHRMELSRDTLLDRGQRREFQDRLEPLLGTSGIQIGNPLDVEPIFDIAYDELIGIGPLGPLWRDDEVNEIMVSGPYKVVVERRGALEVTPVRFRDLSHLERTARNLAGKFDDRAVSRTNPLVTVQLPGARVQFVWQPLAVNKVVIAIRKFGDLMGMDQLLGYGSLSQDMADFLQDIVRARATLLISGGTSSGKTTVINAVSAFIPDTERVVTIEDALELKLVNSHVESLVTKEASSSDDHRIIGTDELLKASLRLRPDRIIVGEIRDSEGCAVMLEAANTGHDGTMTTLHANSGDEAITRMATLLRRRDNMPDELARAEVCTAIDVVVQVVKRAGRRYVSEISLVDGQATVHVEPIFTGHLATAAGTVTFKQVAALRADTDVAQRMLDAGIDPSRWGATK